jgi:hypothetical protein
MTTPRPKDSCYTEGITELAIQAFKKGQFQSLQAAALTYDAPITTVRRHARDIRSRRDSQLSSRKLSSTEEETLIQWILSMDQRLRRHPYDGQRTFLLNGRPKLGTKFC